MPKSITSAMRTHLAQTSTTLAMCWRLERRDGQAMVTFDHAAIRHGHANNTARYIVNFAALDNMTGVEDLAPVAVTTGDRAFKVPSSAWGPADAAGFRYAIASIRTMQEGFPQWARPVRITMRERGNTIEVIAIDRPVADAAATRTN